MMRKTTHFYDVKIEVVIPMFMGALGSLVLAALIGVHALNFHEAQTPVFAEEIHDAQEEQEDLTHFFAAVTEKSPDAIRELYRDSEYREWVIDFFTRICSSREIAQVILDNAEHYDVPPALAFALSWEESRFNPYAVNRANQDKSVDRGLFQLNNRTFPNLKIDAFFDIRANARYGISHLRFCLDSGGSEVSALAMYNAGTARVKTSGAPKVTLDYIHRILENRQKIESRFHIKLMKEEEIRLAGQSQEQPVTAAQRHFIRFLQRSYPRILQRSSPRTLTSASPL